MIEDYNFIIIGRSTCPFCVYALDFCIARGLNYTFLDYNSSPSILKTYKDFHQQETVPIILSNHVLSGLTKKVGGYQDLLQFERDFTDVKKKPRKATRSKKKNN